MAEQHLHQTHPDIIRRLKRAEGHLAGVIEMIEAERSCLDLAQQLHAVESAIANAKRTLINDHLDHCLERGRRATRPRAPIDNSSRSRNTFEVAPMAPLSDLLQQGAAHAWLFIPSAILLGALHGLEPGHSKTMMAAFIIAVRGTVPQAVPLGLAATVSHTLVVWAVALVGLRYASQINLETTEPYFQVASAVLIVGVAVWMIATWRSSGPSAQPQP
jgi:DNA-binding FrmR family transcriptional regulator